MEQSTKSRATFHSRLGFLLVSAGCAIGLGNVWKFPYICGENGGGAFLVIYLLCLLLLGLPILICEFTIGRGSRRSISQAMNILEQPGSRWHVTKYMGIAGNYLLMMFYTMVAGWMLYYAYLYISGKITSVSADETALFFSDMLDSPGIMILFAAIVIVLCIGICALGLKNGIEKVTKVMMLLLMALMIVLVVNSLRLENALEGVKFYLVPDLQRLEEKGIGSVAFAAMTHAFFTLSVGIGAMEIFGSYIERKRRLMGEAVNVVILDTSIAFMAGLIIIPACFAYGIHPDAGPSLLFITLPNVFHHMATRCRTYQRHLQSKHQRSRCSRLRFATHQSCHFSECRDASIQYYRCHQSYSQETNGGRRIGYRAQGFEFPRNRRGESILVRR